MPKEHQVKRSEQSKPAKQANKPARETQPLTEVVTPAGLGALPPNLARAQIAQLQRLVGNDVAQDVLAGGSIQRNPGPPPGGAALIPILPDVEARRALALDILKKGMGGRIKQESKVTGVQDTNALRDRYDDAMIGHPYPVKEGEEKRPWVKGDVYKCDRTQGDFPGFLDPAGKGVIIDLSRKPDEQVATIAHEMLHDNASPEFQTRFGRGVDEGMTEKLTQRAFTAAGYAAPKGFYEDAIALVNRLGGLFGDGTMEAAYFGGPQILQSMFVAVTEDEDLFDKFCNEVRKLNWGWLEPFFTRWGQLAGKSEIEKKIEIIKSVLNEWWVSDDDIARIEGILAGCSSTDKVQIRMAVFTDVNSLYSEAQRKRVYAALSG